MGGMLSTDGTSPMGGAIAFLTRRKRPAESVSTASRPVKIQRTVEVQEEDSDEEIIEKDEQIENVEYSELSENGEQEEEEEEDEEEELNVYKSSEDDEPKPVGDEQVDPDSIDIHSGTRNSAIPVNGSVVDEEKTDGEELIIETENLKKDAFAKATNNVVVAEKTPETESALKVDQHNRSKIIDEQIDVNSESSNGQTQKSENGVNGVNGGAATAASHDRNKNKTVVANELAARDSPTPPADSSSTLSAPTIVA